MRSLDDLNDPAMRQRLQSAMKNLASEMGGDPERIIKEMGDRYI